MLEIKMYSTIFLLFLFSHFTIKLCTGSESFNCTLATVELNEIYNNTLFDEKAAYHEPLLMRQCSQLLKTMYCSGRNIEGVNKYNDVEDFLVNEMVNDTYDLYENSLLSEAKIAFVNDCSFLLNKNHLYYKNLTNGCDPFLILNSNHSENSVRCEFAAQTFLCNRITIFTPPIYLHHYCKEYLLPKTKSNKQRTLLEAIFNNTNVEKNFDLFFILGEALYSVKHLALIELQKHIDKIESSKVRVTHETQYSIWDMFVN